VVTLAGKKVLVTGAAGFIGSRLVEKLVLEHNADVRAFVHRFSTASRIARFPIEMVAGDIADGDAIDRAVEGCHYVFHLAHVPQDLSRNLQGARNLAEACLRHSVEHLVHVSTASVYEPFPDGDLFESTPVKASGWGYGDNKLAGEQEFLDYFQEHHLPVTIIMPTIVYGPYGRRWTATPVSQILSGKIYLPDSGQGLCNAVYVDDVADAMVLAAETAGAAGERVFISGREPVTWQQFFAAFEDALGIKAQVHMSTEKIEHINRSLVQNIRMAFKDPFRLLSFKPLRQALTRAMKSQAVKNSLRFVRDRLGDNTQKVMKALPPRQYIPEGQVLALYRSRCHVRIDKAQELLGYDPKFDFNRGMELTSQYIRWAYRSESITNAPDGSRLESIGALSR
jgi:nucleoside-diphosphate-sugar epimerase